MKKRQMKKRMQVVWMVLLLTILPSGGLAGQQPAQPSSGKKTLMNRIDFGNAYITGQSIKSGAVYLLQRKKSAIKSMLKYRTDYRDEILEDFSVPDTGEALEPKLSASGKP